MSTNSPFDDRMVLAGNFTTWNGASCGYLVRLNTNGTLDLLQQRRTGADDRIMHMNWFSDGSGGLIYGYFRSYNGQPRGGIAGLNANGSLNGIYANITAIPAGPAWCPPWRPKATARSSSAAPLTGWAANTAAAWPGSTPMAVWTPLSKAGWTAGWRSVALQADGKILVAGNFGQCQGYARTSLARLNPDGSLDTAFNLRLVGGDNSVTIVNQVVPLSNGQMMITGDIWNRHAWRFTRAPPEQRRHPGLQLPTLRVQHPRERGSGRQADSGGGR